MRADGLYQIGEVAERTGLSLRTVRYYEEVGLAAPSGRTSGGFRLYTEEDVIRLELVRRLKVLDLPLESTREMLDAVDRLREASPDEAESDALLDRLHGYLHEAEGRAAKLEAKLEAARGALAEVRSQGTKRSRSSAGARR